MPKLPTYSPERQKYATEKYCDEHSYYLVCQHMQLKYVEYM